MKQAMALTIAAAAIPAALMNAPEAAAAAPHSPAAHHHPAGGGRDTYGSARTVTLTVVDNGRTVRVRPGEIVNVRLEADPNADSTTWWRGITETGPALVALPQTLMAMRGVTLGRYQAVRTGSATLTSTRAVCPQQTGGITCHAVQGWSVTVDVR